MTPPSAMTAIDRHQIEPGLPRVLAVLTQARDATLAFDERIRAQGVRPPGPMMVSIVATELDWMVADLEHARQVHQDEARTFSGVAEAAVTETRRWKGIAVGACVVAAAMTLAAAAAAFALVLLRGVA